MAELGLTYSQKKTGKEKKKKKETKIFTCLSGDSKSRLISTSFLKKSLLRCGATTLDNEKKFVCLSLLVCFLILFLIGRERLVWVVSRDFHN